MIGPRPYALAGLCWALSIGFAHAQDGGDRDLLSRVRACASVEAAEPRLACYDRLGADVASTSSNARSIIVDQTRVDALEREAFGLSVPNLSRLLLGAGGEREPIASVETRVARIIRHGDGRHSFVMDDGQRWTQTEPQRIGGIDPGDAVTIRRGALSSYILSPDEAGRSHRVRREN
ncbi:MAG: hypothetical protein K2P58_14845 [Hyphomonadaceae bacterium]|nr:hypothetical protein [Hyphomonadaceae bacterium]